MKVSISHKTLNKAASLLLFASMALFASATLFAGTARAADIRFKLLDATGRAVPHAVVMLPDFVQLPTATPQVMDQLHNAFVPYVLAVARGQAVSFPNSDNTRHHVYSFSKPKVFELQLYQGVPEAPIVFDRPGIVVLGCNIHDQMIGYIYVSDGQAFATTDAHGQALVKLADGQESVSLRAVRIWHPALSQDHQSILDLTAGALLRRDGEGQWLIRLPLAIQARLPAPAQQHAPGF